MTSRAITANPAGLTYPPCPACAGPVTVATQSRTLGEGSDVLLEPCLHRLVVPAIIAAYVKQARLLNQPAPDVRPVAPQSRADEFEHERRARSVSNLWHHREATDTERHLVAVHGDPACIGMAQVDATLALVRIGNDLVAAVNRVTEALACTPDPARRRADYERGYADGDAGNSKHPPA